MVSQQAGIALDDVEEHERSISTLRGDRWVDDDAKRRVIEREPVPLTGPRPGAPATREIVIDGEWRARPCAPEEDIRRLDLNDWWYEGWGSSGLTEKWFLPETDRSDWMTLRVPGSVQSSMVEKGLLDDPYWNTNTYDELVEHGLPADLPWHFRKTRIEQSEWWFATTFTVPGTMRDDDLQLHFDGVDYSASFYLNGRPLGMSAGMFGGPDYDISGLVDRSGENHLVVRVFPPPANWYGILKGNPGWGWHYGHLISVGIWRSVRIRAVPAAECTDAFVSTAELSDAEAVVDVQFDVNSRVDRPHAGTAAIVTIVAPDGGKSSHRVPIDPGAGVSRWTARIKIPDAQVWWPRGYGEQPLYSAEIVIVDDDGPVGPRADARFGIRTIEMAQHNRPVSPDDYRWQFVVNGTPLFIKGTNWCWTDPMNGPGRTAAPFLEHALDAGIQMLRAWGGGIIESEEFYDVCDEAGILVYQEFPYSWGPPDAPGTDLAVLDDQVRRVVLGLRNHPSLIMWGGGNENTAAAGSDEGLLLVGRRCRQFDPSRPFHRADPWGGSAHNYEVYHFGKPMDSGYLSIDSVLYGEFGLPSMPSRRSCERMLPRESLDHWPPGPEDHGIIAHMHQFALFDFVKGLRYQHYGPVRTWDDYIEYSQMAQGDALRFAAERQRAGAVDGSKTGFWFYKLTELFPGHSWGILDFYGVRKDSFYRAKQVCRPRALFATYDHLDWNPGDVFDASIFAANDTPDQWARGPVVAELYDRQLQLMASTSFDDAVLAPNSTAALGVLRCELTEGRVPALLAVRRPGDDTSFDSWYWFNYLVKTPAMREVEAIEAAITMPPPDEKSAGWLLPYVSGVEAPLRELPGTVLNTTSQSDDVIVVRNTGSVPAFNIQVRGRQRDIDVSDSGFCLAPGSSRLVTIGNGSHTEVVVTAWNAAGSTEAGE